MKKILTMLFPVLLLLLAVPRTVQAAAPVTLTVKADKSIANPGDTVNYTVSIGAVENLGGLEFHVNTPEGMTIVEDSVAIPDGVAKALDSDDDIIKPTVVNGYKWSYSAQSNGYTADSELVILTFAAAVAEDAAFEEKGVTLKVETCFDNTSHMKELETSITPAKIIIEKPKIRVTGISLDKTALTLTEGETAALTATVAPVDAENKNITWSSDNTAIATVTNGMVTALKPGTAKITVTTEDGNKTAVCEVTVKAKVIEVSEVKLDKAALTLTEEETETLTATILPENATNQEVTWTSSNPEIATVEVAVEAEGATGKVTALKAGTATITATTANGKTAVCEVTVNAKEPKKEFGDVSEGWKLSAAQYVYDRGVMTGKGTDADGKVIFAPDANLSRQEFAQIIYAAEGKPDFSSEKGFTDVKEGQWYTNAVLWAASQGIVSGYPDGRFGVDAPITREQLAAMLYKYAEMKGYDVSGRAPVDGFADADQISGWATDQLQWAVANGVMSGKGAKLDPTGTATRAECAAMLRTFMVKFEG